MQEIIRKEKPSSKLFKYKLQSYSICYSPHCEHPMNRIFNSATAIQEHRVKCSKWIISSDQIGQVSNLNPSNLQPLPSALSIHFASNPIDSLIKFSQQKSAIQNHLQQKYQEITESIINKLKLSITSLVKYKLSTLEKQTESLRQLVVRGINKLQQQKTKTEPKLQIVQFQINSDIENFYNKNPLICDTFFYDDDQFKDQLMRIHKIIQECQSSLIVEKRQEGHLQTVKYRDMMNAIDYLNQDSIPVTTKLNKLCFWEESDIIFYNSLDCSIKCPLCPFEEWINKQKLNNLNQQLSVLTKHAISHHLPFIGYCFYQRMAKQTKEEITYEQIVYLMKSQSFTELVIVDGSNTRCTHLEVNPNKLYISFSLNKPNDGECQCRWLHVFNPQQAAFYVILLIQEVAITLKKAVKTVCFKKQYFNLMTKIIAMKGLNNLVRIEDRLKTARDYKQSLILNKN